jgi:hypothetical protein
MNLKKVRQCNGEKKEDKRTNNDKRKTHRKLKNEKHESHEKPGVTLGCPE